jgi:hypothetical protein
MFNREIPKDKDPIIQGDIGELACCYCYNEHRIYRRF